MKRDELYRSGRNPGWWTYGGAPVLEPLEHSVLEIALDGRLIVDLSVLEPLEHSVLEEASDIRLRWVRSVLEPLEHSVLDVDLDGGPLVEMSALEPLGNSVPDVALAGGDCSLIRMTESDLLVHSGLSVTVHVDMDYSWMAPWDAGGTFRSSYRPGMAIWRNIWSYVVRFSRMPEFPATGYLGSFGGLARICVIDLHAGVLTAPVVMVVDFNQMDFPKLQFPPVGVEVLPSTSVTLTSAYSRGRGCLGNGHSQGDGFMTNLSFPRASCTPGEICAAELDFPLARFPPGESCAEGLDYISLPSQTGSSVCAWTVTGSLLFRSPHRRVWGSSCSALLFPRRFDEFEDIPVSGRRTSARWQDIHAHLLVTFDYCFFSSDIITSVLIVMTHGLPSVLPV